MLRKALILLKNPVRCFGTIKIDLPAFSPTMESGKILSWSVKEGDAIREGDSIAEIETDKATLSYEISDDMYLAKIVVFSGSDVIKVGTTIAYAVEEEGELKGFTAPDEKSQEKQSESKPVDKSIVKKYPSYTPVLMPALSPTMKDGKLVNWTAEQGQEIAPGDILANIETDKATMEYETQDEGFIAKFLIQGGGEKIEVGQPLFILVEEESDIAAFQNFTLDDIESQDGSEEQTVEKIVKGKTPETPQKQQITSNQLKIQNEGDRVFISPLARSMLSGKGLTLQDLQGLKGSGPNGRFIQQDIENFEKPVKTDQVQIQHSKKDISQPLVDLNVFEEIEVSGIRKIIAERLTQSKRDIPHYYLESDIQMDELLSFKKKLFTETGVKLSVNDFIIKAVAKACIEVPETNSYWMGDKIQQFKNVDVSFAVDLGGGLITPIVKEANNLSLSQINASVKELVEKAQNNKLMPDDYQGGTFTISNLGSMGIKSFSAVINPPQSCILAIGATERTPVYDEESAYNIKWVNKMCVTLSADHRGVDGAVGAKWINSFKKHLEQPMLLLL